MVSVSLFIVCRQVRLSFMLQARFIGIFRLQGTEFIRTSCTVIFFPKQDFLAAISVYTRFLTVHPRLKTITKNDAFFA